VQPEAGLSSASPIVRVCCGPRQLFWRIGSVCPLSASAPGVCECLRVWQCVVCNGCSTLPDELTCDASSWPPVHGAIQHANWMRVRLQAIGAVRLLALTCAVCRARQSLGGLLLHEWGVPHHILGTKGPLKPARLLASSLGFVCTRGGAAPAQRAHSHRHAHPVPPASCFGESLRAQQCRTRPQPPNHTSTHLFRQQHQPRLGSAALCSLQAPQASGCRMLASP
jgi:hypothetical protein